MASIVGVGEGEVGYGCDNQGKLVSVTGPDGRVNSREYDGQRAQ